MPTTRTLPAILPQPSSLELSEGIWRKAHKSHFSTGCHIAISAPSELDSQADLLAGYLRAEQMFRIERTPPEQADIALALTLPARTLPARAAEAAFRDEHYRLTIHPVKITLEAASPDGIAMGIQTLRQLLSGQRARLAIRSMIIEDQPAMTWRGLHLDVSRHFFTAETVCRFIDLAAFHKFNLFHWHLTDDQGWRLPVEGYPRLTEIAAWRNGTLIGHDCDRATNPDDGVPHGGFYTHEEIRGIVAYAAARGIRVLPEVDVPGHVQALVTAYPEFGNTGTAPGVRQCWGISDSTLNLEPVTFAFLDNVVSTLAELFPFRYLHFGGDEAKNGEWHASPRIAERMRELGHAGSREVQAVFTRHLSRAAENLKRCVIGWDEIIEHDTPSRDTAVMYWRDSEKQDRHLDIKALMAGHPLVLANWSQTYFDLYQKAGPGLDHEPLAICGNLPLEKVYSWHPLKRYPEQLRTGILGAQAQVWTEYISDQAHLDYMTYPRACALSQVLWSGDARESFQEFEHRLEVHLPRLDRFGVTYRPMIP